MLPKRSYDTEQSGVLSRAWLFGLPVDCVSMRQAMEIVERSLASGEQLVFATPNINFLAEAHRDSAFARAVLRSDAFFADGAPLLWLATLMGFRLPERVAGSDLFEKLRRSQGPAIRVFFFGGDPGVAKAAHDAVTRSPGRFIAAGYLDPGFGTADELSSEAVIAEINAANADLLVVSLGAKKGHLWIDRNRANLNCRVVSHLGAVIAFAAGTVRRAPPILRRVGLEWLWRTLQEPRLAIRYLRDGAFLAGTVATIAWRRMTRRLRSTLRAEPVTPPSITAMPAMAKLTIAGQLRGQDVAALERMIENIHIAAGTAVELDINALDHIDAFALGALHKVIVSPAKRPVHLVCNDRSTGYAALHEQRATSLVAQALNQ